MNKGEVDSDRKGGASPHVAIIHEQALKAFRSPFPPSPTRQLRVRVPSEIPGGERAALARRISLCQGVASQGCQATISVFTLPPSVLSFLSLLLFHFIH